MSCTAVGDIWVGHNERDTTEIRSSYILQLLDSSAVIKRRGNLYIKTLAD